ncbi:hypothetical protein NFI95_01595 [Acetobacteraceae bacterium KSS8]|uniref:DUF1311 domain-containing protein n=1 Tax=Endosaccharibacter trunci TaxID=2812733 RepID=A0ABT1W2Q4_9PROT|nr:hypothetical protein [Acetobacteraceae bacterium KSS8]
MMNPRLSALGALVLLAAVPAMAQSMPGDPDPKQVEALCRRDADADPPAGDLPTPAQRERLAHCDSEALLYGIGRPADPVQARLCAFVEADDAGSGGPAPLFAGNSMLMTIYANGMGVPRNPALAVKYACMSEDSSAAREYRVLHVAGLLHEDWYKPVFSPCDDATSGEAGGECAAHDARFKDVRFAASVAAFASRVPARAQAAFASLRAAQKHWAELRSDNEIDQSGTLRSAFVIDEQQRQNADFVAMLERLDHGAPPKLGRTQRDAAQRRIDAALQRLPQDPDARLGDTTITAGAIRATQAAWVAYRDAWGRFAAVAYPGWGADGAEAWVSIKRADMLEHLPMR